MKAVFYLDALAAVLPLVLMLYTYFTSAYVLWGEAHFNAVSAKVERIASLSTLIIYDHSERDGDAVVFGYVKSLPQRVDVEFPIYIDRAPKEGMNCYPRIVWDGQDFVEYFFCG